MGFAYINNMVIETKKEAIQLRDDISMRMLEAEGEELLELKEQLNEIEQLIDSEELSEISLEELEMARSEL